LVLDLHVLTIIFPGVASDSATAGSEPDSNHVSAKHPITQSQPTDPLKAARCRLDLEPGENGEASRSIGMFVLNRELYHINKTLRHL
jgi:hypothetical protein